MADKLNMESKNILSENIENIASLFPNALVESEDGKKIDFDILKQELSDDIIDGPRERYHLDFPGKREAIVEANRKTTKTLRPIKEKSVDFENTKNIYIEGDNLEALKILQESYLGKIKCIYIDPPYNTGNDFVYNDKFSHSTEEELKASGRIDDDGNMLISKDINNDSNGRYHSDWLKMMYPRLKLARNLLSDDGVIFISIDDNEVDNLRKLCDEVFGENNFVACVPTVRNLKGKNDTYGFANIHDYFLCYTKVFGNVDFTGINMDEDDLNEYSETDDYGRYKKGGALKRTGADAPRSHRPNCYYPIFINTKTNEIYVTDDNKPPFKNNIFELYPTTNGEEMSWLWEKNKVKSEPYNLIVTQTNEGYTIYKKQRLEIDGEIRSKRAKSIFMDPKYDSGNGTAQIKQLFNGRIFDNPKPTKLIADIIDMVRFVKNDLILDFFSGSATTAHAVMKLNAEDGGNRQFILVQLPESTDEGSEAYKAGYKTICDIGEERIRRAGKKIKDENEMLTKDLDVGFRVYKVDSSNMKDIYYTPDSVEQSNLLDMVSNVKEDRTSEDLLTQVILNLGLPLDMHIEEKTIGNNHVYFVEENALVACFDDTIDLEILNEIAKINPLKICLRESSFEKDQDKINLFERLKKLSPDTEVNIL